MKKKLQIGLLLFVTLVLLGAVGYLSFILTSDSGKGSPTQIRKTKASAQTYHKLIALNTISPTISVSPAQPSPTQTQTVPSPTRSISPTRAPLTTSLSPTASAVTPRLITSTPIPTAVPTSTPMPTPTTQVVGSGGDGMSGPDTALSPTSGLLAYRNPTITNTTPTVKVTPGITGNGKGGGLISPTILQGKGSFVLTVSPTKVATLPESGWMQTSLILFIVATSTIIFSLLF